MLDSISESVNDSFADETKIASKENLVVDTGVGQVKLLSFTSTENLRPNASGDQTNIPNQEPLSGEHWDKVDEVDPDDDFTRVYSGEENPWGGDLYELPDHSEGSGEIQSVTVRIRAKCDFFGGRARIAIKTLGEVHEGDPVFLFFLYWDYWQEWDNNPSTENSWTWDEIDSLQAGVSLRSLNFFGWQLAHCTQVYVEVEYIRYEYSGTLTSTNLLSGLAVASIDNFGYTASSIPAGTSLKVQFSQDGGTWCKSDGTSGWDDLIEETHTIDLSPLGWSGGNFYYRIQFTSLDGENTPVLDQVRVRYSEHYQTGAIASQVHDTGAEGTAWDNLSWSETLPSDTNITFEVRASDTYFDKGDATPSWTDLGTADSPVTSGLPSGRYLQWRATLSTGDKSNTPILHEVTIFYSSPVSPPPGVISTFDWMNMVVMRNGEIVGSDATGGARIINVEYGDGKMAGQIYDFEVGSYLVLEFSEDMKPGDDITVVYRPAKQVLRRYVVS